jgi:N-acetylglucosamine kinase-like BadF-type ATPase
VAYYLGIDGGGSKTTCMVGDEASLLATATTAGSNIVRVGEASAGEALHAAIYAACKSANVVPAQVERTCVGMAGAARTEIHDAVRGILAEALPGEIKIVGDMETALQAAFDDAPGVVVIAGTGSIAYGRDPHGQTARAGGWGFAISDEGSGHWIGRAAIAAAMRARDLNQQTLLLEAVQKAWGTATQDQLVLKANATPAPDFAALFPVVLTAADQGDAAARAVLNRAGAELSSLAKIVAQRLFAETDTVPLAMSGGVFAHSPQVREVFYNSLRSQCSNAVLNQEIIEPARGALNLARKPAGPR